jgi:hypothetical protein|tara:strand:- start:4485 stop:4586 length:102 start_codon:yes stop_codon:yes gene_type:complete
MCLGRHDEQSQGNEKDNGAAGNSETTIKKKEHK